MVKKIIKYEMVVKNSYLNELKFEFETCEDLVQFMQMVYKCDPTSSYICVVTAIEAGGDEA